MAEELSWTVGSNLVRELGSDRHVVERIRTELATRGWSQSELSKRMSRAGHPMHASVISRLLKEPPEETRNVSIDQVIGLSRVFDIPFGELLLPSDTLVTVAAFQALADGPRAWQRRASAQADYDNIVRVVADECRRNDGFTSDVRARYQEVEDGVRSSVTDEARVQKLLDDSIRVAFYRDVFKRVETDDGR